MNKNNHPIRLLIYAGDAAALDAIGQRLNIPPAGGRGERITNRAETVRALLEIARRYEAYFGRLPVIEEVCV